MSSISLYIVDDHQMLIDGIKAIIRGEKGIRVCGECTLPLLAIEEILMLKPDIVLTDINMPEISGAELVRKLRYKLPNTKFIALSMFGERGHIREMLQAGVQGYILKNTGKEELMRAITNVHEGGTYFSDEVNAALEASTAAEPAAVSLTSREIDIIECISKEMTNAEIAKTLFISERTVETHRKNIFRKTGSRSVLGLVKFAIDHGFIK
jgi:two-component system, NarL family, nitrate/nitrite response regulator NarL